MATKTVNVTALDPVSGLAITGGTAKVYDFNGDLVTPLYSGPLLDPMPIVVDDSVGVIFLALEIHKTGYWTPTIFMGTYTVPVYVNLTAPSPIPATVYVSSPVSSENVVINGVAEDVHGNPVVGHAIEYEHFDWADRVAHGDAAVHLSRVTTGTGGAFSITVPRPPVSSLTGQRFEFIIAKDDPAYWQRFGIPTGVDPTTPAEYDLPHLVLRAYQGNNTAVLSIPQGAEGEGGQVWVYDLNEDDIVPHTPFFNGQTEVSVSHLGTGPYLIELYLDVTDHDWDGYWPHIDERSVNAGGDPDTWDVSKATQFTLSPGRNDLGTFHFADYPAKCTRTFPKKEAKLRKVGFSQKAAALLLNGRTDKRPVYSFPEEFSGTWSLSEWKFVGHFAGGLLPGPTTDYPADSQRYWEQVVLPSGEAPTADRLVLNNGTRWAWYGSPVANAVAGDLWVVRQVGTTAGWPDTTGIETGINLPTTFKDLLRAGFSPRQARTWLRVKGMATPVDADWHFYPSPPWYSSHARLAGRLVLGFERSLTFVVPAFDVANGEGAASLYSLDADITRDSPLFYINNQQSYISHFPPGEYQVVLSWWHPPYDGAESVPSWLAGMESWWADNLLPVRGDPRLDALIRGGFTTTQARLLLETL